MKDFKEKQMIRKALEGKRRFGGPLVPRDEKIHNTTDLEMNEYETMQKKHLKAYLRGETKFVYKGVLYDVESKFIGEDVKEQSEN
jgi:hypothetical protein